MTTELAPAMTLDERIARLEAVEDIRTLKARYCELCDASYLADELAELFTEDAVWDGGESLGRHQGRTAIREFFAAMPSRVSSAMHYVTNPRIQVLNDGRRARGRWYLLQMSTLAADGRAIWLAGDYEDEYVREAAGWRFERVVLTTRLLATHEPGWRPVVR